MTNVEYILIRLEELSSEREFQRDLWSGKIQGKRTSFSDTVRELFDDAWLAEDLDCKALDRKYSPKLCATARELWVLVKSIDHNRMSYEEILNHPKMDSIREKSRDLREYFRAERNHFSLSARVNVEFILDALEVTADREMQTALWTGKIEGQMSFFFGRSLSGIRRFKIVKWARLWTNR